jgi:hypothetical protein
MATLTWSEFFKRRQLLERGVSFSMRRGSSLSRHNYMCHLRNRQRTRWMSSHRRTGCSGLRGVRPPQSRGRTMRLGASCCCLTFVRAGRPRCGEGRGRRCRRRRGRFGSHDFAAARARCGSSCLPFPVACNSAPVCPRHVYSAAAVTPSPHSITQNIRGSSWLVTYIYNEIPWNWKIVQNPMAPLLSRFLKRASAVIFLL